MHIGNQTISGFALAAGALVGIGAGVAAGYGQARGIAARSADGPLYPLSQIGAGTVGLGLAAGAATVGGVGFALGGMSVVPAKGLLVTCAAIGAATLGILGGTVMGMAHEQALRGAR